MTIRGLMTQTVGLGLLLMSGCQTARTNIGDDFARLMSSPQASTQSRSTAGQPTARPRTTVSTATAAPSTPTNPASAAAEAGPSVASASPSSNGATVALAGKSENELRAMLGAPTSEEDRPPGKRWRYRDGQCTLDVQLYPDVQTKQFGTLAYEVKSDDNTDEGKRLCLAQLQSRVQAGR
jgi:hypothetical protein